MKAIRILACVAVSLVVALAGAGLLQLARDGAAAACAANWMMENRLLLGGAGLALTLLVLIQLLSLLPAPGRPCHVTLTGPQGDICITLDAIRDYLEKSVRRDGTVLALRPRVRLAGDELQVRLETRLRAGGALPEVSARLQQQAREALERNLGLTKIGPIRVVISEIATGAAPAAEAADERNSAGFPYLRSGGRRPGTDKDDATA